jgi:hypothetical protein
MAVLFGLGSTLLCLAQPEPQALRRALFVGAVTLATALLAWQLDLWRWRIAAPQLRWMDVQALGRLLLWFTWPAWPLALWTLWRWRRQLLRRDIALHMGLPVWYVLVTVGTTVMTQASDRSLLLGLPAMATLAAFALPTLKRTVSSLIDWFTLIFFTGCAFVIWLFWIAMQTGIPPEAAANVARRAPGFIAEFSALPFAVALVATLAWAWLVKWRVGRHRAAIWKSVVLPAGGAALSWLLLMTLWLPLLDFARSYAPMALRVQQVTGNAGCVAEYGLTRGQIAAFQYHARLKLEPASRQGTCAWLMVDGYATDSLGQAVDLTQWTLKTTVRRPADNSESVLLYQHTTP